MSGEQTRAVHQPAAPPRAQRPLRRAVGRRHRPRCRAVSAGLEDPDDVLADLGQALDAVGA